MLGLVCLTAPPSHPHYFCGCYFWHYSCQDQGFTTALCDWCSISSLCLAIMPGEPQPMIFRRWVFPCFWGLTGNLTGCPPNTSISSFTAIIPTCPHLQFKTTWLFHIDQCSTMFYFCSKCLSFARRKYLGSYLPSDTVLTVPSVNSAGAFSVYSLVSALNFLLVPFPLPNRPL